VPITTDVVSSTVDLKTITLVSDASPINTHH
jgi:hypothetical protein